MVVSIILLTIPYSNGSMPYHSSYRIVRRTVPGGRLFHCQTTASELAGRQLRQSLFSFPPPRPADSLGDGGHRHVPACPW